MDKSQQVKDLMLLEIADSVERAMEGMKSMNIYEELRQARDRAEGEVELLQGSIKQLENHIKYLENGRRELEDKVHTLKVQKVGVPTMPVILKAVAIAIFREGMAYGAGNVCDELDNAPEVCIKESEYCGGFEVSFREYIDLSDYLDLDYLRSKAADNSDEEWVVDCLKNLCAAEKFECRIHGVDDQQTKNND